MDNAYIDLFSPLTGMVQRRSASRCATTGFRPYGDRTDDAFSAPLCGLFSPPYGDCIRMTTPKYPVMELSSPYGMVPQHESIRTYPQSFRPLAGTVPNSWTTKWLSTCFRPLAGIVQDEDGFEKEACVFAPLWGWYIERMVRMMAMLVFAPCGDCTSSSLIMDGILLFSSPYGIVHPVHRSTPAQGVFAPLRGLYPKYITKHRKTEEPDG